MTGWTEVGGDFASAPETRPTFWSRWVDGWVGLWIGRLVLRGAGVCSGWARMAASCGMAKNLRVMWDFDADDPIWDTRVGVGLEGLGLSDELCAALRRWSAALAQELWQVINSEDEVRTPEVSRLDDVGRALGTRVQDELRDGYVIT